MNGEIRDFIGEYTRRYVAADVDGVTDQCEVPFLAVREGEAIHLADRDAVHEHFGRVIGAYGTAGFCELFTRRG
jgi:hypothetical protein